ncbi:MAG: Asp-tRNA(Asn)/Glu-tRNA(Gln) amidotransferase subunit GatB [Myxococcota bacterium]|nr:Asp-tRNA(Asn)/Glu-tRNA(Gln) amidotransferase subunit GatB [Myxococcota bacterium]
MKPTHPDYEVVIGLEVHCQLRVRTKLFTPAPVTYGAEPNTATLPVCLGLPGALPVLNGPAVELAVRAGLATHCTIQPRSIFARKNYFYPDLPKGYQISQFEEPLATGGYVDVPMEGEEEPLRVRLTRIHMEEDAGKSVHEAGLSETHVDLNRAGVPLIEIVSEPDIRSPEAATAYLRTLREIVRYIDASDADMEKGHFRCDVNVSLRPHGSSELGTRTELKNLNSFRFVEAAIRLEIDRQAKVLSEGGTIEQVTLGYDADRGRTFLMRGKEDSDDYRYFPDPDLVPLVLSEERIAEIRAALPELPEQKRARFTEEYGLPGDACAILTEKRGLADFFERAAAAAGDDAKPAAQTTANWMLRDVLAVLREDDVEVQDGHLEPEGLGALIRMVEEGRVTARSARSLLPELIREGGDPERLVQERGLESVSDEGALEALVAQAIEANPKAVASYAEGDKKSLNFLMGQVMKASQGKADPGAVRKLLAAKLES